MEQRYPGYFWNTLNAEVIERARKPQEGHKGPPGYYLLTVWGTYFPWSLMLPAAMVHAWKNRHLPIIRFSLAAVIGPWLMFELVATKLPHYVLPTFPFIALLTADMLIRAIRGQHEDISSKPFLKLLRVWGGVVVVLSIALWMTAVLFKPLPAPAIAGLLLLTIITTMYSRQVYARFAQRRIARAAMTLGLGWLGIVAICFGLYFPHAPFLHISTRVAEVLNRNGATSSIIMIDYKETSLAFYQGGAIRPEKRNDFLQVTPPEHWPGWIVLTREIWRTTPAEIQQQFEVVGTVTGLAYSDGGRIVEVMILKRMS